MTDEENDIDDLIKRNHLINISYGLIIPVTEGGGGHLLPLNLYLSGHKMTVKHTERECLKVEKQTAGPDNTAV